MRLALDNHAWDRGFQDGEQGKPLTPCPYAPGTTESWSWVSGYIEGKAARYAFSARKAVSRPQEKNAPAAEPYAVPLRSTATGSAARQLPSTEGSKLAADEGSILAAD